MELQVFFLKIMEEKNYNFNTQNKIWSINNMRDMDQKILKFSHEKNLKITIFLCHQVINMFTIF